MFYLFWLESPTSPYAWVYRRVRAWAPSHPRQSFHLPHGCRGASWIILGRPGGRADEKTDGKGGQKSRVGGILIGIPPPWKDVCRGIACILTIYVCTRVSPVQMHGKVEKILKGSLALIPSPSPSVKIQIMGVKVWLKWKSKTLLGVGQHTFENKKCVDITHQCFALLPQLNFPAHNLNFHWRWRWWNQIQITF